MSDILIRLNILNGFYFKTLSCESKSFNDRKTKKNATKRLIQSNKKKKKNQ